MIPHAKIDRATKDAKRTIQKAFYADVRSIVDAATIKDIADNIQDYATLAQMLAIDAGAIGDTLEAVREAYKKGGKLQAPEVKMSFDMRAVGAEDWIKTHSSKLVTRINDQQRESIRIVLQNGIQEGRGPRQTALDIVGRMGKSGRREGGIIGLTDSQTRAAIRARLQLRSGGPAQMAEYLNRKRRDRRFDHIVHRAIRDKKPVTIADTDRLVGRYKDRLLQTRGETIARTESIESLNSGRHEALQQAADKGIISKQYTKKVWDSTSHHDPTRELHIEMDGQERDMDEPFEDAHGNQMMYPGDTSLGAAAETIINCRCTMRTEIDFIGQAAAA